jgi:sterol desaturase/sphingolipid hydroxylase (fatty acid hydroxylase superfamily)
MDWLVTLITYLLFPIGYVLQPGSQFYWPTYLAAGVTAIALYLVSKRKARLSLATIRKLVLPSRLFLHDSTKLDAKLFFLGVYYLLLQFLLVGGATVLTIPGTVKVLNTVLGQGPAPIAANWVVTGTTMFFVFMMVEFGYWFSHYLMHKIPFLWEFHKVHHSAEVLTPLTEWRQHPAELSLFAVMLGVASCVVQGPMVWYFGASAQVIDPTKANLLSMAFWYTILHLRHSELPLYATGLLGKIIQAPAHHQVHHSTDPRHFDMNLGYCLSVWDWAFGTLYVPRKGEKFAFGLGHKDEALKTVMGSMVAPISRAGQMVFSGMKSKIQNRKIMLDSER